MNFIIIVINNGMKSKNALINLLFLITIVFASCKKNAPQPQVDQTPPEMQQFIIEKKNNTGLESDIHFEIKNDSIISSQANIFSKKLKPTFATDAESISVSGITQQSGITENDFASIVTYNLKAGNGIQKNYYVKINWQKPDNLPHLYITTEGGAGINSKENYVNATLRIDGRGKYENYNGTTQIRGRGNSTWTFPKKPYRLKLTTKSSLLGLPAERDWVLLANYIDPTLMTNAVAMKIGSQLELPFTNHIIPVNVTLNGAYIGSYNFTEQIEVGSGRIDIGDDGLLLEIDTNFDEEYKFHSKNYALPVMIKSPDLDNNTEIIPISGLFDEMESLVYDPSFPNNAYKEHIDVQSLAKFILVQLLTDNEELNHPKSIYLFKTIAGRFNMGPIWDFDWGYAFESGTHFSTAERPLFWTSKTPLSKGTTFFARFLEDPAFIALLKQEWANYKSVSLDNLIKFVEDYAIEIESSKNEDYKKWKTGDSNFMNDVNRLKNFLAARVVYIDRYLQEL